jgi:hypothetical protein
MNQSLSIIRRLRAAQLRWRERVLAGAEQWARVIVPQSTFEPELVPVPVPVPVRRIPRVLMSTVAALALGTGLAAAAPIRSAVEGNLVDVQVLVDGSTAPLYQRNGAWDRTYFQAFRGQNYSLVVTNQTNQRVGVLISVDGLNVVNGQRTRLDNDESMYVLDPYENATIRGWRNSLNDVRRFVFVDEERSYASRTDQANGDMGWIRVVSFQEKQRRIAWREDRPQVRDEMEKRSDGTREPSAGVPAPSTPSPSGDLRAQKQGSTHLSPPSESAPGTGWGDRKYDPVRQVDFLAAETPTDRFVLRYEYESGLRALGINVSRPRRVWQRERGELGFAQAPRW